MILQKFSGKCNSREEAGQAFDTMKGWMESDMT
jgi:hypothetical protein